MSYAGTIFGRATALLRLGGFGAGIVERKLQLVYVDCWIMLLFGLATIAAVTVLIRERRDFRRAVPLWTVPLLCAYCLVVGLFFFNRLLFTHAMLQWPLHNYIFTMLGSLAMAVVPVWCLYVVPNSDSADWKQRAAIRFSIVPLMHSLMMIIYILYSPVAME